MVTSNSRLAYPDVQELLDKVLESSGARVEFNTEGQCKHFRTRMHTFRRIDREYNAQIYKPGDPMFALSEYDRIVCRIRNERGKWYCYFKKASLDDLKIEMLDDITEEEFFAAQAAEPDPPAPLPIPAWEQVPAQPEEPADIPRWVADNREQLTEALVESTAMPTFRRRF